MARGAIGLVDNVKQTAGNGAPAVGVTEDYFASRYTFYLALPETLNYTFYPNADDTLQMWVDGVQLGAWKRTSMAPASVVLSAGERQSKAKHACEARHACKAKQSDAAQCMPAQCMHRLPTAPTCFFIVHAAECMLIDAQASTSLSSSTWSTLATRGWNSSGTQARALVRHRSVVHPEPGATSHPPFTIFAPRSTCGPHPMMMILILMVVSMIQPLHPPSTTIHNQNTKQRKPRTSNQKTFLHHKSPTNPISSR
jgi:hypothetical protein